MRTIALLGAAMIAASLLAPGVASAWTSEQPSQQDESGLNYSDPDAFKALQDKVNGKTDSQSGFFITGGVNGGDTSTTGANPYALQPLTGRNSAFGYSPMPGFRGAPQ